MSRNLLRWGLTSLALVAGPVVVAQTVTTGAITGTVSNQQGQPLAGVTIRVASGQITRTAVTSDKGQYRLTLLNPGIYQISATKGGFVSLNQKVSVGLNETATVNLKLAAEGGTVVEVIGSPVGIGVDTSTTQVGSNFAMETIQSVPMGRDMNTLANFAPGVVDSGASGMNGGNLGASISGASGAENQYVLDGLTTTDFRYGGIGNTLVTDFIDQVDIQTGGFKPEYSALGGVFNAVTKSGTNTLKGSAWLTWDPRGIQAKPKSELGYYTQTNPLARYDIGAEIGGPIIKDKLFYFVGIQNQIRERPEVSTNYSGFTGSKQTITNMQFVTKLNWYVTQDLQLTFFGNYNPYSDKTDHAYPGQFGSAEFGVENKGYTRGWNVAMDWTITPTVLLSAKIGNSENNDEQHPVNFKDDYVADRLWFYPGPAVIPGDPIPQPNADLYERITTYGRGGFAGKVDEKGTTDQIRADLSWYLGNHVFKFGVSQTTGKYSELSIASGSGMTWQVYRSGTRNLVRRTEYSQDATVKSKFQAVYLQDTWEMAPGMKIAYGFRFENQDHMDKDGVSFLKFKFSDMVQPRIGLIWDMNNDGQSKLSLNFGRTHEVLPQRMSMRQRGNEVYLRDWFIMTSYRSVGVPVYDPTQLIAHADYSTPFSGVPIQDGIKVPSRDEWILGYDKNLPKGFSVGVHAKHRVLTNVIEDFTPWLFNPEDGGMPVDWGPDPGYGQAIIGNPKPGVIRWQTRKDSLSNNTPGVQQWMEWDSTYPEAKNTYQSVDITIDRKTERSYLSFSYTWSRLFGTYEGLVSSSNGQADANITASWDYPIYCGDGLLPLDRTHAIKLIGSQSWDIGPGRFTIGWNWTYFSGTPISQLSNGHDGNYSSESNKVIDYGGYGNAIPVDFKFGQFGRTPSQNNVDLRLEYAWKIGRFSLMPSIDVFNMFNTRTITGQQILFTDQNGDPTNRWATPTGAMIGRRYRAGIKVRF